MRLKTIKKLFVFLVLLLTLYPSISVFAAQSPYIDVFNLPRGLYIEIYGDAKGNLEMTASNKGIFQYKIFAANNVDITKSVPASDISVDAFVKTNLEWGSNGRRAEVRVDPLTGTATVTCDFTASDKSIFIIMNYNNNPSMVNFNMSDIAMGSKSLYINNSYDFDKNADIEFLSDYLTDTGNNTATFKYKATFSGRDITKTFPTSMINAVTSIDSSIEFDPSTGTGTIKFNSPVTDQVIKTTLTHKLNGITAILNTIGLSKAPVKRQEPTEISKINFVTGSLLLTDKDTATFKYRVLDHNNSNITKTISTDDMKATALIGTAKAEVSLNSATGTGTIKYNFTDNDKKAMIALMHKSGVEISAALNIVSSEVKDVNDANNDDLQIAQIVFLPTGIKNFDTYEISSYRIYNQYGKNITKEIPASSLAFTSNVNSTLSLFSYGIGEFIMRYNTHDANRTIIVSIMDKATGIKAAMNIGKASGPDTDDDTNSDTVKDSPTGGKAVRFNDAALEQEVRKLIHKPEADITEDDVKDITDLNVGRGCTDLTGIENLKNLGDIDLFYSNINSLSPLKQLPKLRVLKFYAGSINDIKTLTELTNLQLLDMNGTKISDEDFSSLKKALPNCFILR
jgi:hypothetical protein